MSETKTDIVDYTVNITKSLIDSLGPDSQIPVFPSLGNHDVWPVNVEDYSAPGSSYAVNKVKPAWTTKNWLSESEGEIFGQYGYYSKPFPFNQKGKVISMNMNACNNQNWMLLDQKNRAFPEN